MADAAQAARPGPHSLRNVAALITAILIMQAGQGVLNVHLPLAFAEAGYSRTELGLVAAAFSAGFMAGAWWASVLLARVGHIRVYSAFASIFAAVTLALHAAGPLAVWLVLRAAAGLASAMMFAAVESWMSGSIPKAERGHVLGVYQVGTKAVLALGPFLALGMAADAAEPWMIASALLGLALVPVCFTTSAEPEPPKAQPLALRDQVRTAPAAVMACFGAGLINTGVMTLAPVYAAAHFGQGAAAPFYAAAWIGSLILQWPAGRISDRLDRRLVIAALLALSAITALILALFGARLPFWAAAAAFAFWGAGALSYYGVAVAHMADRSEPSRMAQATSGLLFVWAAGAVLGPALQGVAGDVLGPGGVFWFAAIASAGISSHMLWRVSQREARPGKGAFSVNQATSTAATETAFADDGETNR